MTLYLVMPGLQIFLSAYLRTFRVFAKDKKLGRNFKRIRPTYKQTNWKADNDTDTNFGLSRFLQMTLFPVMPRLQTFLSAYLCTFRVFAKHKNLGRNFKRIRRRDKLKGWQTYWQQFRLVKIFANDTLPSYARATDISVCLPMHIQSLCQRQKS